MAQLTFGLIGAGNMGRALADRLATAGHPVLLADRSADRSRSVAKELEAGLSGGVEGATVERALGANVVVLALYYPGTLDFAARYQDALVGKIVVDISNPLDESFVKIGLPEDTSGAERLASEIPASRVVKAFNTLPAATLARASLGGVGLDCFVASNDEAAKRVLLGALTGTGLRGIDAGTLDNSRLLERLTAFGMELGQRYGLGFEFGFKYLPESSALGLGNPSETLSQADG